MTKQTNNYLYLAAILLIGILLTGLALTSCGDGTVHIPGPPGKAGSAGVDGASGKDGKDGAQGAQGVVGPQGPMGPQGAAGAAGTTFSFKQLCGNCITSYPNVFPELGMCVGGKLYGVYSTNGGFWVEIVPGTYSSNGIGCSCTLTISPNCFIQ